MTRMRTTAKLLAGAQQLDLFTVLAQLPAAPSLPTAPRRYERQPGELEERAAEQITATREAFWQIVDEAWHAIDRFDRLMRTSGSAAALESGALAEFEDCRLAANDGENFGLHVNVGPRRLMKALRVRARAAGRWPMWGLQGKFRFDWRGLTMVANFGWLGPSISLDTDRHAPGTLCHSSTGYRSFLRGLSFVPEGVGSPEDYVRSLLDGYLAAPAKNGNGLGGKLKRYVPWWMDSWRQANRDLARLTPEYEAACPGMTPAEDRPGYWADWKSKARVRIIEAEARMHARGIDPHQFFPETAPPRQAALL